MPYKRYLKPHLSKHIEVYVETISCRHLVILILFQRYLSSNWSYWSVAWLLLQEEKNY